MIGKKLLLAGLVHLKDGKLLKSIAVSKFNPFVSRKFPVKLMFITNKVNEIRFFDMCQVLEIIGNEARA